MRLAVQVALGVLVAAALIYGAVLVLDTRARVVQTHMMTTEIYGRVFPERTQRPGNSSPDGPKE